MIRAVVPSMTARGGGAILVSTSSSVKEPIPNLGLSTVLRASVSALAKTLALELAPSKIRVNQIIPGRLDTDRVRELDEINGKKQGISAAEAKARSSAAIPMGRYGEADEFGRVGAFLLSNAASYMTGATVQVDGGQIRERTLRPDGSGARDSGLGTGGSDGSVLSRRPVNLEPQSLVPTPRYSHVPSPQSREGLSMSLMRKALLAGSTNPWLRDHATRYGFVRRSVSRFMPGERIEDALRAARELSGDGITTILTHLGENLTSAAEAEEVTQDYLDVMDKVAASGLDAQISIKPTQLGLDLDRALCERNLDRLIERAEQRGNFLWIDMESSPYVDPTWSSTRAGGRGPRASAWRFRRTCSARPRTSRR